MSWEKNGAARLLAAHETIFSCPVCDGRMKVIEGRSLRCGGGHNFDLAREGYLNLLTQAVKSKYGKSLFAARKAVNENGLFDPIRDEIAERIAEGVPPDKRRSRLRILDAGCGEGSLLSGIKRQVSGRTKGDLLAVGMDLAKEGVRLASKGDAEALWCAADLAKAPFRAASFDVILNILSPSNYAEFGRLLSGDGLLIKVVPEQDYLREIRRRLYAGTQREAYSSRRAVERFRERFTLLDSRRLKYTWQLRPGLLEPLLDMTPLAWGAGKDRLREVLAMEADEVTVDVTVLCGSPIQPSATGLRRPLI
ncbi:putative RNA methyltransferase [Paenibacillus sp. UNC499MF]|uniref:putative RNA methyltransferase n=1 Tax=Paenibacillus sp. UNC499MF TaxID=1502751 RepID=UPI0008A007E7|nr:methyltransferase domain-containing protein [Paenibacillus sp. UNC499MF]SEG25527.1 23S rRNA (guanine745-N1)-methyltransferase [Paenibacillus sp. UNC499MF]